MQTFLPSADFAISARALDIARLNRQVSEVNTLARTLWVYERVLEINQRKIPFGVQFPLACRLWTGANGEVFLRELQEYHRAMATEFRKFANKPHASWAELSWPSLLKTQPEKPRQLVWPALVHASHRSKLLQKEPGFYRTSFDRCGLEIPEINMPYLWDQPIVV